MLYMFCTGIFELIKNELSGLFNDDNMWFMFCAGNIDVIFEYEWTLIRIWTLYN